jgi:Protein of unknown function (DUF3662)/Inner membrane component of T3SS, cytoplasmic domain
VGVLSRFERKLGGMVEGVFARAFKSEVQPVEVAAALQRELDDQAAVVGRDRTLVPNHFVVELGDHDHDRLAPYERPLTDELAAMVREHADDQRYSFVGPVRVELERVHPLDTGVFRIRSDVAPGREGGQQPPDLPPLPPPPPRQSARPVAAPLGVRPEALFELGREPDETNVTTAIPRLAAAPSFGRIQVREGKAASYDFELKHKITVIGRGTDTDIRLTDHAVSRRHAEIRIANGATMLNDLQSTNGTTVNGVTVTTMALSDGDEIRIGETVLTYRAPADAPAPNLPGLPNAPDNQGQWG